MGRTGSCSAALYLVVFFVVLLFPASLLASGFFHPETGARSLMRGGAVIAGGNDLSCLYSNVANLAQVDGTNIYSCVNFDIFHTYYRREPYLPAVRNYNPFDPIQAFIVSSDFGLEHWTFAAGAYGAYGVTNRWPEKGPQRYNIIEANAIQVYQSAAVAWNPTDWIRLGVKGCVVSFRLVNYYGFSVLKDRNPAFDVTGELDAYTDYVPSWGAGFVVSPVPKWFELAFFYLPSFDVVIKGDITAEMPDFYGEILQQNPYTDELSLPLAYPEIYKAGARFMYHDKFDIEFALAFIPWHKLVKYDVDLKGEEVIPDFEYPLQWKDTWNYRVGGTYRINQHWWLHGGYQFENTANPSYLSGTETDRHFGSGGLTMRYFGIDLDLGYAHIFQYDIETPPPTSEFSSALDDGRGRYKTNYDCIIGAFNINIERMYHAFHGKDPW